jgi:hypothetical protein
MIQEKAQHIIIELMATDTPEEFHYSFPRITVGFDIRGFTKQPCDLDGVDVEYIDQRGESDMHYGQIAYRLHEDTFLVMDFDE